MPLYFQVAEQLERAIVDGVLAPGERVPNEVALADELGLSRPTMRQAIQILVDKGMLVRKRGVGTQVVKAQIRRPVELTSLNDDLVRTGQDPSTKVLSIERGAADAAAAAELRIKPGDEVWQVERLRLVGDQPLALMANVIPCAVLDLGNIDLTERGCTRASVPPASISGSLTSGSAAVGPTPARRGCLSSAGAPRCSRCAARRTTTPATRSSSGSTPTARPLLLRGHPRRPLSLLEESPPLRGTLTMCRPPSGCAASRAGITMSWRRRLPPRSTPFDAVRLRRAPSPRTQLRRLA